MHGICARTRVRAHKCRSTYTHRHTHTHTHRHTHATYADRNARTHGARAQTHSAQPHTHSYCAATGPRRRRRVCPSAARPNRLLRWRRCLHTAPRSCERLVPSCVRLALCGSCGQSTFVRADGVPIVPKYTGSLVPATLTAGSAQARPSAPSALPATCWPCRRSAPVRAAHGRWPSHLCGMCDGSGPVPMMPTAAYS